MKKLLFNTLSKQIKELEKTAKNTILALLNEIPNKTYTSTLNNGLKLLGYKIVGDNITSKILYNELYEIELFNIDNVQLLNVISYINEIEFSED